MANNATGGPCDRIRVICPSETLRLACPTAFPFPAVLLRPAVRSFAPTGRGVAWYVSPSRQRKRLGYPTDPTNQLSNKRTNEQTNKRPPTSFVTAHTTYIHTHESARTSFHPVITTSLYVRLRPHATLCLPLRPPDLLTD